ncbi:hypothetical protein BDN70DRAFT_938690 [Pholiota conissans]|uniref:Uncharacterized protein n=1 Tax=Pholiota conissans TaxID=109636 RepID=A0A9P5YNE9_9AGAR|nr:hypothetical protein BDN70DRAFT_938690 [Pholiota conissans]
MKSGFSNILDTVSSTFARWQDEPIPQARIDELSFLDSFSGISIAGSFPQRWLPAATYSIPSNRYSEDLYNYAASVSQFSPPPSPQYSDSSWSSLSSSPEQSPFSSPNAETISFDHTFIGSPSIDAPFLPSGFFGDHVYSPQSLSQLFGQDYIGGTDQPSFDLTSYNWDTLSMRSSHDTLSDCTASPPAPPAPTPSSPALLSASIVSPMGRKHNPSINVHVAEEPAESRIIATRRPVRRSRKGKAQALAVSSSSNVPAPSMATTTRPTMVEYRRIRNENPDMFRIMHSRVPRKSKSKPAPQPIRYEDNMYRNKNVGANCKDPMEDSGNLMAIEDTPYVGSELYYDRSTSAPTHVGRSDPYKMSYKKRKGREDRNGLANSQQHINPRERIEPYNSKSGSLAKASNLRSSGRESIHRENNSHRKTIGNPNSFQLNKREQVELHPLYETDSAAGLSHSPYLDNVFAMYGRDSSQNWDSPIHYGYSPSISSLSLSSPPSPLF